MPLGVNVLHIICLIFVSRQAHNNSIRQWYDPANYVISPMFIYLWSCGIHTKSIVQGINLSRGVSCLGPGLEVDYIG